MYAKDALCVAAITVVYSGIKAVAYLGGNEFVERDSENRCPDHARTVVCHLQDPRVATADVSASQQECYYNRNHEDHTLSVLIITSFFYCKYKQFPLNIQGKIPIPARESPMAYKTSRFKPAYSLFASWR